MSLPQTPDRLRYDQTLAVITSEYPQLGTSRLNLIFRKAS
jgi:hypothetical protein